MQRDSHPFFFALRPAPAVRDLLTEAISRFAAWELPATWTHPDDLHLTLLHLGGCDSFEIAGMTASVDEYARSLRAPGTRFGGLYARAGSDRPDSVAVAITDGGETPQIHRDLAEILGESPETSFKPHITLAKSQPGRIDPGKDWPQFLAAFGDVTWGACPFDALVAWRTDPRGPVRYDPIETWTLPR